MEKQEIRLFHLFDRRLSLRHKLLHSYISLKGTNEPYLFKAKRRKEKLNFIFDIHI